jgi:photosystem II stability/assembly factor-like uncharacterized protein
MLKKLSLGLVMMAMCASAGFAQEFVRLHKPTLTPQNSGTTQLLIAVSPVNSRVVWASGQGGTFTVTTDGGDTWRSGTVPDAAAAGEEFRDVQGVSDKIAYLMSIGNNTNDFKIYKTVDGGDNWTLEFTNSLTNAFYDCMAFWTPRRGLAHSDSVNGVFPELRTEDGKHWESISGNMPPALPGEASFSSSGTCITTEGERNAWITTGGSTISRVIATRDGGNTWHAYDTPLPSSPSAGGLSIAFRDPFNGIVGGGDLSTDTGAITAVSHDGGRNWHVTTKPPTPGSIFCLAYASGMRLNDFEELDFLREILDFASGFDRLVVITTETLPDFSAGDAAWSPDEGNTWYEMPEASGYWGLAFANPHAGWFVGNNGQILKISF